jgi:hypothetical protein
MRRTSWLFSITVVMLAAVAFAADPPDKAAKTSTAKAGASSKASKGAVAKPAAPAPAPQPKTKPANDPRATSLFRSAQNLEKTGKKAGAVGLYRDVMIRYPESPEAGEAEARIKALGGKVPTAAEINPAPPAEEAKFVRAPKPKYASQDANRAALNEAIGGAVGGAMTQPGGGGYGNQGGYR